jgi:hypothetical protein
VRLASATRVKARPIENHRSVIGNGNDLGIELGLVRISLKEKLGHSHLP